MQRYKDAWIHRILRRGIGRTEIVSLQSSRSLSLVTTHDDIIENKIGIPLECEACQYYQNLQHKETLLCQEFAKFPWQTIRTYLFHYRNSNYVIISD